MKLCPLCQDRYEDTFISCAHDRTMLITDRGAMLLKEADVKRRAHPLYLTYAIALSVGLVGGLLIGDWGASVSSPITFEAMPSAEAAGRTEPTSFPETTADGRVDGPLVEDVATAPTGGAESPPNAATSVQGDEQASRRVPPADKPAGPKNPAANPSTESAEAEEGKAATGSNVSAGREPEKRQGLGPCRLLVSARSLSIRAGGGSGTITVSSQNVDGPASVTASTKNWPDINVFPESRGNPGGPARFSVISVSKRAGTYAVNFASPCGVKTVPVTVQQP